MNKDQLDEFRQVVEEHNRQPLIFVPPGLSRRRDGVVYHALVLISLSLLVGCQLCLVWDVVDRRRHAPQVPTADNPGAAALEERRDAEERVRVLRRDIQAAQRRALEQLKAAEGGKP